MEGSPGQHIGTEELAKLLEEFRLRGESVLDAVQRHPHLADCPACREQFNGLASFERQLKTVKPVEAATPRVDCPSPAVWREIAGGVTSPAETLASIEHASRCDYCGPLLRGAVAELSHLNGEITEAEREQIASLESAGEEWQYKLVRRITEAAHSELNRQSAFWGRRWLTMPRLAIAGASLLAVVGAGSYIALHLNQPGRASRLLASAYTEKRTLELRIAGAHYAPLRVSRGTASSFTSRPASLLSAEAMIANQLQSNPSDPSWLQLQAQADLLEGKYDAAVEALQRALELEPHSPGLLTDLATAYFQRAQQEDRKDDLAVAYEYLSQSLQLRPDDPVARFNRAVVAEHQFLFHQALDDWTRYLQVDPHSDWVSEAREAYDRVLSRLKEHDASHALPLLSPAQIAAAANDPNLRSTVDARIEEYLSQVVRSRLPQAYPEKGAADLTVRRALFFLADLTARQHNDRWLSDLLRGSSSSNFPLAVAALAKAAQANTVDEYSVTDTQGRLAKRLFRSTGNDAGTLRAAFELAFAAQIERHSDACRDQAGAAVPEAEKHSYAWLQIQLGLEQAVCSGLMGDLGSDEKDARQAMSHAKKNNYGALYLRALGFVAGDLSETGNLSESSKLVSTGLNSYWLREVPVMRGYNLYTELAEIAVIATHPNLQLALWREGIALIDPGPEVALRAIAHQRMAQAAIEAHQPRIAQEQYAESARLFALSPPTEAIRSNTLENEVLIAQLEADQGNFEQGIARLTRIQEQIQSLTNNYLVQMFYTTLGELQLRSHRATEAEQSLRPALTLAKLNLASIHSEAERITWSKNTAALYFGLAEAELVQGRVRESLDTYEAYMGASQQAGTDSSPSPAHHHLLPGEIVIAYAALPDGVAIWVFDDRNLNARWITKPTRELEELAARFHDLSSDPQSDLRALRRDARSLYAALITPVEPWLTGQPTLIIEADGWLSRVPFEALLDSNDHYLIERGRIVHSLGQDSDARLRNDGPVSAASPALIVGSTASSQAEGLIPIPEITREADDVAAQFKSPEILKGDEATLSSIKKELPAAAVFHFAGHSLATLGRTGLLLENEQRQVDDVSLLDADTLRRLDLRNMRLAMLSACGGDSSAGSGGFNSITETLLRAGVPHVVASRWNVDSVESRGFVDDFYRDTLAGQSISEAVRITSRRMLANPRTSHPYYWSAFAAYGQP